MSQALHQVLAGPYYKWLLYVGPEPFGPRGGVCGNVVDATLVATGNAARKLHQAELPDNILLRLRKVLGRPVTGYDRKLLKQFDRGEFFVQVFIASLLEDN